MNLKLLRLEYNPDNTIGDLLLDGRFFCNTLEDTVRRDGFKIPSKTAIPAGIYRVIMSYSERFKRVMPLLVDVPMFSGIRIHAGNTEKDTDGCLLVGTSDGHGSLVNSRKAFEALMETIEEAKSEEITIEIINSSKPIA